VTLTAVEPSESVPHSGHVIICGLHDVGLRVVEQLHAAGQQVVVVDDGTDPRLARIVERLDVPHVIGDASRDSTLRDAGLGQAIALICLESSDLRNLAIALLVRELQPHLRLVVQLTNAAVGRAMARMPGPVTVLDAAELAAPSFVDACLQRNQRVLPIDGEQFVIAERAADRRGNLRTTFGDLAPIAVIPSGGGPVIVCPGRDLVVDQGDRVTLVGSSDDFADLGPLSHSTQKNARARSVWLPAVRGARLVRGFIAETEHSMRLTLTILVGVAVLSVLLLRAFYNVNSPAAGMSYLDATYFTVETLTTVGFGDFFFAHQEAWLRVWAILLMISGATLVTILYALLTNLLVSRRLAATAGSRKASGLRGHVILIGLGSVGVRVLEGLRGAGRDVVILERDEGNRYLGFARAQGVPVVIGDSTLPQSLIATNLAAASAIAVLTSNDLANIETGLAVDDLLEDRRDTVPVVLRVFDRQLAHTVERSFNFSNVRSTSALAAPWFVGAALGLTILNTFYVADQPFLVGRLTIAPASDLVGATMLDLSARTRVIAISRAGSSRQLEYPPRRDTRFGAGDQAYLIGPYEELLQVLGRAG
jgi:Trk K+ transport system NAD-binding subunit